MNINYEDLIYYHIPKECKKCNGVMVYEGVGEYHCEDCGELDRDDYGKVRHYIETHNSPNVTEIERETGVSSKTILKLLKDSKFEVSDTKIILLRCELCKKPISSGRFCEKCEKKIHENIEADTRTKRILAAAGVKTDKMHYLDS